MSIQRYCVAQDSDVRLNPLGGSLQTGITARARRMAFGIGTFARRYPLGFTGALIILTAAFLAAAAPVVTVHDPNEVKLQETTEGPSWSHPLGTDYLGRDILTRIIYGGRLSLQVAVLAVLLGTTVGAMIGVVSAYVGGAFDITSQRVFEVLMAFPGIILAMVLLVGFGSGIWTITIAIAITRLSFGVRVVRAVAMSVKELTYVGCRHG